MKKILTIAVACAGLMSFTACNDFLDEEPRSTLVSDSFYQTEAQAEGNVNYLYRTGATNSYVDFGSAYTGPFAAIQEELTGYFSNSYEGQEIVCRYSRNLERQENTMQLASKMDGVWDNCYRNINVANGAIKYIPSIDMAEETANRLVAEAKFFRAFSYFYLVKTFGAVPFYTEPYEVPENMEMSRTETSTIYAQIEADLQEAVNVLPATSFAANGHRITKYAAAMMLTDVYMYQHKYADAANTISIVVESGVHSLTTNDDLGMNSAFNKLRSTDDLPEAIYSYEFDNQISNSGWLPTYAFDGDASSNGLFGTYAISQRVHGPLNRYLNIYTENDLRIQPNQFFHWTFTNEANGKTWNSVGGNACCLYYYDEDAIMNTGRGTKDWNIFRYAEALLDAAECIAQSQGVTADAARYLAMVKARANLGTEAELTAQLQGMATQAFIEECWNERLRELPLEFKMWDLCVRVGKFPNISETTKGQITWVDLVGATNAAGATITESDLLWPLSVNEIQRNPNLAPNNPGYSDK